MQPRKNSGKCIHRNFAAILFENLDEPAHMSPALLWRQADGKIEASCRLLLGFNAIHNRDWVMKVTNADLVEMYAARVRLTLRVLHYFASPAVITHPLLHVSRTITRLKPGRDSSILRQIH